MTVNIPQTLIDRLDPLGPHFCLVEGKNPSVGGKNWPKKENLMSSDNPKLKAWLGKGGNYGIVSGYGLIIIDIDNQELSRIISEKLPKIFTVLSPGHQGLHLYYLCSLEKAVRLRDQNGENIGDIQGPGKMVVGPQSIHPNGRIYTIICDCDFAQISREDLVEAFGDYVVPDREIERIDSTAAQERQRSQIDLDILQVIPLSILRKQGSEYSGPHPVHGSESGRNFRVNPEKNCWHCFRHGTGGGPLSYLALEAGLINCEDAKLGALRGKLFKKVLQIASEKGLIPESSSPHSGGYFDNRGKFIPKLLADDIMNTERFITLMTSKEIYIWQDGYYQPLGQVVIEQHCKELLEEDFRKNRFSEVAEFIRASTFTKPIEPLKHLVNIKNGVLNIETHELRPHNPNYHFFNRSNVNFDPESKSDMVSSFLREITGCESDAKVLEEMAGYCLYRGYPYHKALALVGEGANSKSTFLSLVKELLGRENVSGKGLVSLELNRFATASLFGKLANIHADLSDDTLRKTGTFKMLTGGDVIQAEKKFRDSFTFVNYAKLLFSCNKVPEVCDNTDAFFRRWIIIVFPNVFKGENCDPNILEKLTAPSQLSSFLNIALKGLKRLFENDGFTYNKSTEATREDYIRKADPLAAFVMDSIEESQESILLKQRLYSLFAFYCRQNNLPAINKDTFFKNISKHVTVTQVRLNRKDLPGRPYGFKGIRLTAEGEELWSKQSKQSNLSSILVHPEDITRDNKMGKTLDSLDSPDHTQLIKNLKSLTRLTSRTHGQCRLCGVEGRMDWQVTNHKDEWGLLCAGCGLELESQLRSVE